MIMQTEPTIMLELTLTEVSLLTMVYPGMTWDGIKRKAKIAHAVYIAEHEENNALKTIE